MNKTEFLLDLTEKLSPLPQEEITERWNYFSEMIDDRMEDGLSEEEAVAELGTVDEIASQILSNIPMSTLVKEKIKSKRRLHVWELVLLILGFPLWLPLLIAVFAVILSVYVSLWAVIISLWAVFVSLVGCSLAGIVSGAVFAVFANPLIGAAVIGSGLVCTGLSIFLFFGCKEATKGTAWLIKKLLLWIKTQFTKKEEA